MTLAEAAARLNGCANDPRVLPRVAPGHAAIDLAWVLHTGGHVFFIRDEEGTSNAALFVPEPGAEGVYEGHYLFPTLRGKSAKRFATHVIGSVFDNVGAGAIIGRVPIEHRASRAMSRALGFAPAGHSVDPYGRPCVTYRMERGLWAALSAV